MFEEEITVEVLIRQHFSKFLLFCLKLDPNRTQNYTKRENE